MGIFPFGVNDYRYGNFKLNRSCATTILIKAIINHLNKFKKLDLGQVFILPS